MSIKEEAMEGAFRSDRQMILDSIIRSGGRLSEPDMAKQFKGKREYIFIGFIGRTTTWIARPATSNEKKCMILCEFESFEFTGPVIITVPTRNF